MANDEHPDESATRNDPAYETFDSALAAPLPQPAPVLVVWWRDATASTEVPKAYGVGWARADGTNAGTLALASPHSWLSAATIQDELAEVLRSRLEGPVELRPAQDDEPNAVVRLVRAGHQVVDVDLWSLYGLEVVGGVTAELRGLQATLAVEQHLSAAVRLSVAEWAEQALDSFRRASEASLIEDGWHQVSAGRWQLLVRQSGGSDPH